MSESEIIEVVNESGEVIDTMTRKEAEELNHLTRNAIIFVFTPDKKIWLQKRAKNKKYFPGMWDVSACGAIAHGESPEAGAKRELQEEMGIDTELTHVDSFLNVFLGHDDELFKRFSHIYVGTSGDIPKPNDEVEEFKALTLSELKREIEANPRKYTPPLLMELERALSAL